MSSSGPGIYQAVMLCVYVPGQGWQAMQGVSAGTDSGVPYAQPQMGAVGSVAVSGIASPVAVTGPMGISGPVTTQRQTLTISNVAPAVLAASGFFGPYDVSKVGEIAIDINLTVLTGTLPTITFFVERQLADGTTWSSPLYTSTAIGVIGLVALSVGVGGTTNQSLGATLRVRWQTGGVGPVATCGLSILGK